LTDASHPVDYLPELALGALSEDEAAPIREHIGGCESCSRDFAEMRRVALVLPLAALDASPSPAVKDGLVERIAREPRPIDMTLERHRPRWWLAAVAAGIATLVVAGGVVGYLLNGGGDDSALSGQVSRQGRLVEAFAQGNASTTKATSGGMQLTFLRAPGAAEGFAWVQGMPALPAGKAYQAWFSKDGKTFLPSTVFTTESGGVWIDAGADLNDFAAMAFTIEDKAGAQRPSEAPFAVVDLKTSAMVVR
jgi:predicted anti-sigma-YlaC factor YlaD